MLKYNDIIYSNHIVTFNNTCVVLYSMSVKNGNNAPMHKRLDFQTEIKDVLKELDISNIDDWEVNPTRPTSNYATIYDANKFFVKYIGEGNEWNNYASYIKIEYTSKYYAICDIDNERYNIRKYNRKENEEKYVISGPLVDPIVTKSISQVVYHISKQISEINYKIDFQKDIENCYALFTRKERKKAFDEENIEPRYEINTELDKNTFCSPISQKGIGKNSIERTAKNYGIYTNILNDDYISGPTRAYGHSPNEELIKNNIRNAIKLYNKFKKEGHLRTDVSVDEFSKYPKNKPYRIDDKPDIAPEGCKKGNREQIKFKTSIDNVKVKATGDGFWIFTFENKNIVVPMGVEYHESEQIKKDYDNVNKISKILKDISTFWDNYSMKNEEIQQYLLYSKTGYATPLFEDIRSHNSTKKDMQYLANNIPKNMLGDNWSARKSLYYIRITSNRVDGYTPFTKKSGKIAIHTKNNQYEINCIGNSYIVNSYSKVEEIINKEMNKSTTIIDKNIKFEQKYCDENDTSTILSDISGISNGSESTLANEYYTYEKMLKCNNIEEHLTWHFDGDSKTIHKKLERD